MTEHDLIKDNPHLKKPVMVLLGFFEQAGDSEKREDLENAAQEKWHASFGRTPAAVVDILVRRRMLDEQVFINGEPYEGTLEAAQTDESLPDDAQVEVRLTLTEKGEDLRDAYAPAATMHALYEDRPGYSEVFSAVLWACSSEDGASRDEIEAQINELQDKVMRQMAEFENFRKRSEKEKSAMFETGAKSVIEKILPVVDNFERGLATVPEDEKDAPFVDGMNKVYRQLLTELENLGVKPIEAVGKEFDPNFHNAVMQVENDELEPGTVAQELLKGYMYRDTVVRHSMVAVVQE